MLSHKIAFLSPYTRAKCIALLSLIYPATCGTAYFAGIAIIMCSWSGIRWPSSIRTPGNVKLMLPPRHSRGISYFRSEIGRIPYERFGEVGFASDGPMSRRRLSLSFPCSSVGMSCRHSFVCVPTLERGNEVNIVRRLNLRDIFTYLLRCSLHRY